MTAQVPKIQIFKKKTARSQGTGEAGKIAVIGAFKTEETNPQLFTSLSDAQDSFGDDTTFDGCAALPYLFGNGATSVLAVNVSTKSGETWTKTVDATNLAAGLAKIKGEDWDILFVAAAITDAFAVLIAEYLEECFTMKFPAGFIGALMGHPMTIFNGGAMGIGVSLLICAIAAFNFIIDFEFFELGEKSMLPEYYEWYCGFALLVTLVWLYLEVLRLLLYVASKNRD